jgi:hypothetical protein
MPFRARPPELPPTWACALVLALLLARAWLLLVLHR